MPKQKLSTETPEVIKEQVDQQDITQEDAIPADNSDETIAKKEKIEMNESASETESRSDN